MPFELDCATALVDIRIEFRLSTHLAGIERIHCSHLLSMALQSAQAHARANAGYDSGDASALPR